MQWIHIIRVNKPAECLTHNRWLLNAIYYLLRKKKLWRSYLPGDTMHCSIVWSGREGKSAWHVGLKLESSSHFSRWLQTQPEILTLLISTWEDARMSLSLLGIESAQMRKLKLQGRGLPQTHGPPMAQWRLSPCPKKGWGQRQRRMLIKTLVACHANASAPRALTTGFSFFFSFPFFYYGKCLFLQKLLPGPQDEVGRFSGLASFHLPPPPPPRPPASISSWIWKTELIHSFQNMYWAPAVRKAVLRTRGIQYSTKTTKTYSLVEKHWSGERSEINT